MRKTLIVLLAIGLFFLSTTAEGADWKSITTGEDADAMYVDTESIKHISKTVVRAWFKVVTKEPQQSESKSYTEMVGYEEHDCSNNMRKALQVTIYYTVGTNDSSKKAGDWKYVTPDTNQSAMHNYLCKRKVTTSK